MLSKLQAFHHYDTWQSLLTTSWTWKCWARGATSTSPLCRRTRPSAAPPGCHCNHRDLQRWRPWEKRASPLVSRHLAAPTFTTSGIQPALLQNEGRDGGEQRPHQAVESPPVILQEEPGENDEATERVVDKHHLGGAAQNPVHQPQQKELPCEREAGRRQSCAAALRSRLWAPRGYLPSIHFPKGAMSPAT